MIYWTLFVQDILLHHMMNKSNLILLDAENLKNDQNTRHVQIDLVKVRVLVICYFDLNTF